MAKELSPATIYLSFKALQTTALFKHQGTQPVFENQPVGVATPPLERANGKVQNQLEQLGLC